MFENIERSWRIALQEEIEKPYVKKLTKFLEKERKSSEVYPPEDQAFNALKKTPFNSVKVVIVGQDPYHGKNQAHGLSFSVNNKMPLPPSLRNIYREIEDDLGEKMEKNGCLSAWAEQGVLLLNSILTVRQKSPLSHKNKGWEIFTDKIIEVLINKKKPVVFILWGKEAEKKCMKFFDEKNEEMPLVLKAAHPSFFSAKGFFGCKHFSKTNIFLKNNNLKQIDWKVE